MNHQGVFFWFLYFQFVLVDCYIFSKQLATKTRLSKTAGEHGSQSSRSSRASVISVKAEPVDMVEHLQGRLSGPIVISSSEDEPTPKTKSAKNKNFPSSLKKLDFSQLKKPAKGKDTSAVTEELVIDPPGSSQLLSVKPAPRRKGKEAVALTEEPVVDVPFSDSTVYLEDM